MCSPVTRTNVPLRDPRSVTDSTPPDSWIWAWRPEMNGSSGKLMSLASRPMVTTSLSTRNTHPLEPPRSCWTSSMVAPRIMLAE